MLNRALLTLPNERRPVRITVSMVILLTTCMTDDNEL